MKIEEIKSKAFAIGRGHDEAALRLTSRLLMELCDQVTELRDELELKIDNPEFVTSAPPERPCVAAPVPSVWDHNHGIITYSSTQATECAVCKERKHTPLRNDVMGGYVCLTCIDRELLRLQTIAGPTS